MPSSAADPPQPQDRFGPTTGAGGENSAADLGRGGSPPASDAATEKPTNPPENNGHTPANGSDEKRQHSAQPGGAVLRNRQVNPRVSPAGPNPQSPPRLPRASHLLKASGPSSEQPVGFRVPGTRLLIGRREVAAWTASCLLHAIVLLVLGLMFLGLEQEPAPRVLLATLLEPKSGPLEQLVFEAPSVDRPLAADVPVLPEWANTEPVDVAVPQPSETPPSDSSTAGRWIGPLGSFSLQQSVSSGLAHGGGLEGRTPAARARLVADAGGTPESEQAVERGLRWLAAHQCDDGSWNFDHTKSHCHGYCRNPGTAGTTTGSTGVVLMAFLGAGYTHREGPYQETVRRGLYYLSQRALLTPEGADLQEGTMYGQGLATIAICEAYAMTRDPQLRELARQAVRFVNRAQDKRGGGWRYNPGQPGDTTVTGWQLMALKSAQLAGLEVPSPTVLLVEKFLDSVQSDGGAQYGYLTPEPRRSTTAIGLLCRMYTGWSRENPALQRGVANLARWGPSDTDLYYDYYATQVMRHWGTSDWDRWNRKMRDHLVATQATRGHEAGSWFFAGNTIESGGRLLNTALAVMILEVYYRYLPLYQQKAFQGERR